MNVFFEKGKQVALPLEKQVVAMYKHCKKIDDFTDYKKYYQIAYDKIKSHSILIDMYQNDHTITFHKKFPSIRHHILEMKSIFFKEQDRFEYTYITYDHKGTIFEIGTSRVNLFLEFKGVLHNGSAFNKTSNLRPYIDILSIRDFVSKSLGDEKFTDLDQLRCVLEFFFDKNSPSEEEFKDFFMLKYDNSIEQYIFLNRLFHTAKEALEIKIN